MVSVIELIKSRIKGSDSSECIIIENFKTEGSNSTCLDRDGN